MVRSGAPRLVNSPFTHSGEAGFTLSPSPIPAKPVHPSPTPAKPVHPHPFTPFRRSRFTLHEIARRSRRSRSHHQDPAPARKLLQSSCESAAHKPIRLARASACSACASAWRGERARARAGLQTHKRDEAPVPFGAGAPFASLLRLQLTRRQQQRDPQAAPA